MYIITNIRVKQDEVFYKVLKQTLITNIMGDLTDGMRANIMGDLTDGMRDYTGVINWKIHRWW